MPISPIQLVRSQWRTLGALFVVALALRLLIFGLIAHEPRKFYTYDSDGYERRALNILRYGQFASEAQPPLTPDLDRTPVYPLYLAAFYGPLGVQPWAPILAQLAIGALAAPLLYLLARELRLPHLAGVLAALVIALDPVSAMNANRMLTETIFTTVVVAAIWALLGFLNTRRLGWVVASAALLGLAALTRPISQFLPLALVPLFVPLLRRPEGRRHAALALGLFLALSLGLTYSWAVRNYRVSGLFTLSTISDTNLIYYRARAVLAEVDGTSQDEAWEKLQAQVALAAGPEPTPGEVIAAQRHIALDLFRQHPVETAVMLLKGVARTFGDPGYTISCTLLDRSSTSFECFPGKSSMNEPNMVAKAINRVVAMTPVQVLSLAWSATLLLATYVSALVGGVGLLRQRRWLALLVPLLLIAYMVGLSAGAEANSRFRVPALPFLALLAGHGAFLLLSWRAARTRLQPRRTQAAEQI
jgi:4-amino-4-deoxy-L-arabinose transferase-like glycosyltransferase